MALGSPINIFEPEGGNLQGREIIVTYSEPKSTVDTDTPPFGALYGTDTGDFGRRLVQREKIPNDPKRPGYSLLKLWYRTLTPEQWLYTNPNYAVLRRDFRGREEVYIIHDDGKAVDGRTDDTISRVTAGRPVKYKPQPIVVIHGFTNDPAKYADAFKDKIYGRNTNNMSNFPTGMQAENSVVLAHIQCDPAPGNDAIWAFDAVFISANALIGSCTSTHYETELVWATVGEEEEGDMRPMEKWVPLDPPSAATSTTSNYGTDANFENLNNMLLGSWGTT